MTEHVSVNFAVVDGKREEFIAQLDKASDSMPAVHGYRADDFVHRRAALQQFADRMEVVLRQHDHKKNWRDKPVEALFRLLQLELEECKVAMEFFTVAEARHELIDIANFCCILYDRLGMLSEDQQVREAPPRVQLVAST